MRALVRCAKRRIRYALDGFRDLLSPADLPERREPIRINFSFHVEQIASTETYVAFREFVKRLAEVCGVRPLLCVTTPHCPQTQHQMDRDHLCEGEYADRVRELARFAEIGYHGHFFSKKEGTALSAPPERMGETLPAMKCASGLHPMGSDNFDRAAVEAQIEKETAWLAAVDAAPFAYVAGWWFLNEEIALLIERHGIRVDSSVRSKHTDSFGGGYLKDGTIAPRGELFVLPPTKGLVEIQSIFYPVEHPRKSKRLLRETVEHKPDKPLYVVLPAHEGEALHFGRELLDNGRAIRRMEGAFKWMDMSDQLEEASGSLGLTR